MDKLQYISQGADHRSQFEAIQKALDGGCTWIQLRYKNSTPFEFHHLAGRVRVLTSHYKATFIVNDNVLVAKENGADGVHLGLDDMSVRDARSILGPDKIIGGTANTWEDIAKRMAEKCDYIGLGPYRFTQTKEKLSPVLGPEGYRKLLGKQKEAGDRTPIYAIGGIREADLEGLMATGIYGVAISGEITRSADPKNLIQRIYEKLEPTIENSR
ncbi:thiamine phosphate synthase [Negadavirga shengliensis]|uniref:Thiamine-phosphate synthase n=1 Tax=Negadavirga shengliensis TaxID=1389218 RepID=A0ABV9T754_9BACT